MISCARCSRPLTVLETLDTRPAAILCCTHCGWQREFDHAELLRIRVASDADAPSEPVPHGLGRDGSTIDGAHGRGGQR